MISDYKTLENVINILTTQNLTPDLIEQATISYSQLVEGPNFIPISFQTFELSTDERTITVCASWFSHLIEKNIISFTEDLATALIKIILSRLSQYTEDTVNSCEKSLINILAQMAIVQPQLFEIHLQLKLQQQLIFFEYAYYDLNIEHKFPSEPLLQQRIQFFPRVLSLLNQMPINKSWINLYNYVIINAPEMVLATFSTDFSSFLPRIQQAAQDFNLLPRIIDLYTQLLNWDPINLIYNGSLSYIIEFIKCMLPVAHQLVLFSQTPPDTTPIDCVLTLQNAGEIWKSTLDFGTSFYTSPDISSFIIEIFNLFASDLPVFLNLPEYFFALIKSATSQFGNAYYANNELFQNYLPNLFSFIIEIVKQHPEVRGKNISKSIKRILSWEPPSIPEILQVNLKDSPDALFYVVSCLNDEYLGQLIQPLSEHPHLDLPSYFMFIRSASHLVPDMAPTFISYAYQTIVNSEASMPLLVQSMRAIYKLSSLYHNLFLGDLKTTFEPLQFCLPRVVTDFDFAKYFFGTIFSLFPLLGDINDQLGQFPHQLVEAFFVILQAASSREDDLDLLNQLLASMMNKAMKVDAFSPSVSMFFNSLYERIEQVISPFSQIEDLDIVNNVWLIKELAVKHNWLLNKNQIIVETFSMIEQFNFRSLWRILQILAPYLSAEHVKFLFELLGNAVNEIELCRNVIQVLNAVLQRNPEMFLAVFVFDSLIQLMGSPAPFIQDEALQLIFKILNMDIPKELADSILAVVAFGLFNNFSAYVIPIALKILQILAVKHLNSNDVITAMFSQHIKCQIAEVQVFSQNFLNPNMPQKELEKLLKSIILLFK